MRSSIVWQILLPLLITLALAAGALVYGQAESEQERRTHISLNRDRENLNRTIQALSDRHTRILRRLREGLATNDLVERLAAASWATEHYTQEMARSIGDVSQQLQTTAGDQQRRLDLQRLEQQLERVEAEVAGLGPILEQVLDFLSREDPASTDDALNEVNRRDRTIHSAIRILGAISTRSHSWQLTQLTRQPRRSRLGWILLGLWVPIALWLVLRPLLPLRHLATREKHGPGAHSREENELSLRLAELGTHELELSRALSDRERETSRLQTANRRLERELALLKIYNENLVNSLRSAIVVTDAGGRISSFNRTARSLLELREDLINTPIENHPLYHALHNRTQNARGAVTQALEHREVARFEGLTLSDGETETLLDLRLAHYQDESGATRGLLWVADDVTESAQMKHQLLAAERMATVGRISAQVAHEIRNPLSAIGLNAELLEEEFARELPQNVKQEGISLLKAITHEIERLNQITEGYLQLARMPDPKFSEADLNQLVADLFTMLRPEMRSNDITVTLKLNEPAPKVWGDPGQLRQALLNIVRNSQEAMPDGGNIIVSTHSQPEINSLVVTDNGPGIPSEEINRVFEPFYSTKTDGTGLGLSLTMQIISDHGGTIDIGHTNGSGTRIQVNLPKPGTNP